MTSSNDRMTSPSVSDVIESEEIVQYLHPALLYLDYSSHTTQFCVFASCLLALQTSVLVCRWVSSHFVSYRSLLPKEKVFWELACVRSVFATFCTAAGCWIVSTYTNHDRSPILGQTATSSFAAILCGAFFFLDSASLTYLSLRYDRVSLITQIHHWLTFCGCCVVITKQAGHVISTRLMLLEMYAPFNCLCWILIKAGYGQTVAWKVNQMLLLHAFHLRSVAECCFWYKAYTIRDEILSEASPYLVVLGLLIGVEFMFVSTPYWCYRKTLQLSNPVEWDFEANRLATRRNDVTTCNGGDRICDKTD